MLGKLKLAPFLLIALGAIFLLNNFGVLPWSIWTNLWKFWPVILILIGVEYLIGQSISLRTTVLLLILIFLIPIIVAVNPFTKNPLATQELTISEGLASLTRAKIIIDLPATNLNIDSSSTPAKLVEGKISYSKAAEKPEISSEKSLGQGILRITQPSGSGLPIISSLRNDTNLRLTSQIPLEIQINTGASKERLNLSKLRVDYLEINSQASDLDIIFGNLYSSRVRIKTSASTLSVKIPKEMEARIKIDSKVKSLSISDRFKKSSGEYKSTGFDKAFTRLDIEIDSVAGSITIK